MPIRVALHHKTDYQYDRLVGLSPQVVRLRPAPHCRTPITAYSLKIEPTGYFINWQQDPQSNYLARLVFPEPVKHFSIEVGLVAEMTVINPFDFFLEDYTERFPFRYAASQANELAPYVTPDPAGQQLRTFLDSIDLTPRRTMDFLVELNQRVQRMVRYVIRMEPGVQACEDTLKLGTGSCRDSAWLLVQTLRNLGLAARFVSGYLIQLKADVKALDGPAGPSEDFTDLHAWAEVYLPGAGWVGLDPTSGLLAAEGHIPLAATPEPASAAPVSGAVGPCEAEFVHEMSIARIHEDPRVTLPYTDEQWRAICALLHFGTGKWYPGEPLPRWALSCCWRKDGIPIWHDRRLQANEEDESHFGPPDARRFLETLALRLGLDPLYSNPAFEDPFYYQHRERQLPVNVDPLDNHLEDEGESERLRRVFEAGLNQPAGFVLPLQRAEGKSGPEWQSGLWMLRVQQVHLVPGDSPIGLRLPLPSLPWVLPEELPEETPVDPMANRRQLPSPARVPPSDPVLQRPDDSERERDRRPAVGESAPWVVRTALCVEPRNGHLYIFMPPLPLIDDYLELVTAVEDTAAHLGMPVAIEGYPPPYDPRINQLKVTPDPGVIEVNIHPAHDWPELVANTTALYEEARLARLGTEKFMLDGRHSGTGGGNHFVMGAAEPDDSPFLRRPDLLRSMLGYWQRHPSLSYMFSGLFIGPTSQAPRIDETRPDSLYELEIAFAQIPNPGDGKCAPWLVDRILRHLLVDGVGNTHRAEFCIDKLYSPDTSTGRLGLLELRGFEMPPHARMSLAQQLLVRAMIAWFWKQPYTRPPVAWGTQLHDQFMLPHFIQRDFREVLDDLKRAGYGFQLEWFAPHVEFRYPVLGRVNYMGIDLELRQATEPWYVLGEEPAAGATARYVDSSVERLQVTARGLYGDRYVVACNGRRVPLHATGVEGEWVAGVRYRAWQPPSCLHPTIGVHSPLVFDIIDAWTGRSVGGCTYHVAHPGGRNYVTFPVNANEAECRRGERFFTFSSTTGPVAPPAREDNPQFPMTLDLRRTAADSVRNLSEAASM